MLDTVIVWFPISPTSEQLLSWNANPLIFSSGKYIHKYFQNVHIDGDVTLSFKYYPSNPPQYPLPRLSVQLSVPKLLFGNNVEMVTNEAGIEEVINLGNQYISAIPWLPKLDLGIGILWRIDPVYNHQVGECVPDFVKVLYKLDYPKRKTQPYPHEGVQFKSEVAKTMFYDKYKESSIPFAYGILRQETSFRHTANIARMMHKPYPTLRDVTFPWLAKVLQHDLESLSLTNDVIADRSTSQTVLEQMYGWDMGGKLFAHLYARQSMSKDTMIANGKGESTIRKYDRLITEAGLALTLAEDGLQLPPLVIRMDDRTSVAVSLSDT